VEVEAADIKGLFHAIADVQEVIDADDKCGRCQSNEIRHQVREVEQYKYYELVCESCAARLQFGQLRVGGGLYPKRKDPKGKLLPNRGWATYLAAIESRET
jgi:hypothetical protein